MFIRNGNVALTLQKGGKTMIDLKAIRARCAAYKADRSEVTDGSIQITKDDLEIDYLPSFADLAANSPRDTPSLLSLVDEQQKRIAELEAERDAAVSDMNHIVRGSDPCDCCKSNKTKDCIHPASCPERKYYFWQWRGTGGKA